MKVDYYLPSTSLRDVGDAAERAQRLGYDGVFSADTAHEPFLPIVVAAERAPGLDFGTSIAVAFARSPMVVASTAWDLADLTGGRFLLGLGTQIRAHITRRFSMPWDSPGPRMREFIHAMKAVWNTWQTGEKLSFNGDHYSLTLMTPFFNPGPMEHHDIPVYIAGVGPYMSRLAGEVCDGFHAHPFHTVKYLNDVVLPNMAEGAALAGRSVDDVEMVSVVFVVTGETEAEMDEMRRDVKQQIAFYASTPAYRGVLDTHGWDFGDTLTAMSKRGEWATMADVVPDEVVDEVAVVAPLGELGAAVHARYDGLLDRLGFYTLGSSGIDLTDDQWATLIAACK
jgi:probable F420-dependent oxidoreductase